MPASSGDIRSSVWRSRLNGFRTAKNMTDEGGNPRATCYIGFCTPRRTERDLKKKKNPRATVTYTIGAREALSAQAQWEVGCPGSIEFDCCRHDLPASINRLYVPNTIFFRDSFLLFVTAFDEVLYNRRQSNLLSLVFSEIGHSTIQGGSNFLKIARGR